MRAPIIFSRRPLSLEAISSLENFIFLDPHYQRQGDVWSQEKQQLLIDSLLNGFIVPPLYWHTLTPANEHYTSGKKYAIVDGRQRLEALFLFLHDELPLGNEFELLSEPTLNLSSRLLSDIRQEAPWLFSAFMRTELDIVIVDTDDIELIEELFSRLNEGVPLSAAEKRNRGPILPELVRTLERTHVFFQDRLPFDNRRYRHYDLIAKFMRIEDRPITDGRVPDLRKADLDRLFERFRPSDPQAIDSLRPQAEQLMGKVDTTLVSLSDIFVTRDYYLGSIGMVTLYYAADHYLRYLGEDPLTREEVDRFESFRRAPRGKSEDDLTREDRLAIDFASYAQGTTSGGYLSARLHIMLNMLRDITFDDIVDDQAD